MLHVLKVSDDQPGIAPLLRGAANCAQCSDRWDSRRELACWFQLCDSRADFEGVDIGQLWP